MQGDIEEGDIIIRSPRDFESRPTSLPAKPSTKYELKRPAFFSEGSLKTSEWYLKWMGAEYTPGLWKDSNFQKLYLQWLAAGWGIKSLAHWYSVTKRQLLEAPYGYRFLNATDDRPLHETFSLLWPDHEWQVWKHANVPSEIWTPAAQYEYFVSHIKAGKLDSLYELTRKTVDSETGILALYSSSPLPLLAALKSAFPEHRWLQWKFQPLPPGYWANAEHQKAFLDEFLVSFSSPGALVTLNDFYLLSPTKLGRDSAGASLLRHCGGSLLKVLQTAYPHHQWLEWLFSTTPKGFWQKQENRRRFLDWFAAEGNPVSPSRFNPLSPEAPNHWYQVTAKSIQDVGGRALIVQSQFSLYNALRDAYPELIFDPSKFFHSAKATNHIKSAIGQETLAHLRDRKSEREILDVVGATLGVTTELSKWYTISSKRAIGAGARFLVKSYGSSLPRALAAAYPEHLWHGWRFTRASLWKVTS